MTQQTNRLATNSLKELLYTSAIGQEEARDLVESAQAAELAGENLSDLVIELEQSARARLAVNN